ncbi:MAG: 3-hydroxyacyl-CoA dehydrogenase [Syntrophaceae bacterium]|nr:3-hydroxyacyl-CoA dehydrogenase [Syntrophaceae bacterium]
MKAADIRCILVLGAGTMGRQIALHFALRGCEVVLYDLEDAILERAAVLIRKAAAGLVRQGRVTEPEAEAALGRIRATTDAAQAADGADLVSESVPEDPVLKGRVFSLFHGLCPARTLFTTNTSSLVPSMFAAETGRPGRFLALHFHDLSYNLVVDVMPHPGTDGEAVRVVREFCERTGLIPIVLKREHPGYLFNHMFMALLEAAQTLAAEGIAEVEDIDRAWMGVFGMPIGPFGLMDRVGIDTAWKIVDYWASKTGDPRALKNAAFLKSRVERGELGQKTGRGFYAYPGPRFTKPGFVEGRVKEEGE